MSDPGAANEAGAADLVAMPREVVDDFAQFGIVAFTTQRGAGTFGTAGDDPIGGVMARWRAVRTELRASGITRLATATQVHGARVIKHGGGWEGWLRGDAADGHAVVERGTALAVTIADCVPVFIAHPGGAVAALHSGWRGTVARIVEHGIAAMTQRGLPASELRMHLGPAICGECYEVSPGVYYQLTGRDVATSSTVDLRSIIAGHARTAGIAHISITDSCTRHNNDQFFSHRAGDTGRQIGVIAGA